MDDNKLKKTDIWKIVQIFDMDGAYIPETAVVRGGIIKVCVFNNKHCV